MAPLLFSTWFLFSPLSSGEAATNYQQNPVQEHPNSCDPTQYFCWLMRSWTFCRQFQARWEQLGWHWYTSPIIFASVQESWTRTKVRWSLFALDPADSSVMRSAISTTVSATEYRTKYCETLVEFPLLHMSYGLKKKFQAIGQTVLEWCCWHIVQVFI